MYLHLGGDVIIKKSKIVAIFDLETTNNNQNTSNFIKSMNKKQKINYVSEEGKEKTLIITTGGSYFSPISSTTLLRRSNSFEELDE